MIFLCHLFILSIFIWCNLQFLLVAKYFPFYLFALWAFYFLTMPSLHTLIQDGILNNIVLYYAYKFGTLFKIQWLLHSFQLSAIFFCLSFSASALMCFVLFSSLIQWSLSDSSSTMVSFVLLLFSALSHYALKHLWVWVTNNSKILGGCT